MEPIKGGGVKIPDAVGTHTGTYQHVENFTVPVGTNGIAGLRVISPYVNDYTYLEAGASDGSNYQVTNPDATTANLAWQGASPPAAPGTGAYAFTDLPQMMKDVAQLHRIVSASVVAECETSTLQDSGEMCAFSTPFGCNTSSVPYATLQTQWDSSLMPINVHKPMCARWYPLKSQFNPFDTTQSINDEITKEIGYDDFVQPDDIIWNVDGTTGVIPWEFGVVCVGLAPSVGAVRFRITVNYEFIPRSQTSMVAYSPSDVDPTEEQLVNSWVSDCPVTGPISQAQASAPAMASSVSEKSEPSGFGMLFNVIEEMAPLIKTGLAFI